MASHSESKFLFEPESVERFEAVLLEKVRLILSADEYDALRQLTGLLVGYAEHLSTGLIGVGFEDHEATQQAWEAAWNKLHKILEVETLETVEVATYLERNIDDLVGGERNDMGEPTHAATRAFYKTFVSRIEHPSIHPTAAWLSD